MNREQVIAKLRAHERELKEAGIVRLSLFGSTARGMAARGLMLTCWPNSLTPRACRFS